MTKQNVSLSSFLAQLRENRIFRGLDGATLSQFLAHAKQNNYQAGETVFIEGEPPQGLYWLAFGALKVVKTSTSGKEQTLHYVKAGMTFNELGAFATLPNPASVIALEPLQVWRIPAEIVRNQVQQDPGTQHTLLLFAGQSDREPSQTLLQIEAMVQERYASAIRCYIVMTAPPFTDALAQQTKHSI